jgi:hypothetical protein
MSDQNEVIEFTVRRSHVDSVLNHYRDRLIQKHSKPFITLAFLEMLQQDTDQYQLIQRKRETNVVWRIPVKVIGDARTSNIDVIVGDNVKLTFVD